MVLEEALSEKTRREKNDDISVISKAVLKISPDYAVISIADLDEFGCAHTSA